MSAATMRYPGVGGNKASISPEEIQASLRGSNGEKNISPLLRAETNLKMDTTSEDIVVIDEADRMDEMGFMEQVCKILD